MNQHINTLRDALRYMAHDFIDDETRIDRAVEALAALDAPEAENLRLAGEVANRNQRALKADEVVKAADRLLDEIEKLEAENTRLREALQWMLDNDDTNEGDEPIDILNGATWNEYNAYWIEGLNKARAALENTK